MAPHEEIGSSLKVSRWKIPENRITGKEARQALLAGTNEPQVGFPLPGAE
jgi:hypothetical protein